MNNLVQELNAVIKSFLEDIKNFPAKDWEKILFDKWSLKQILIHLTGWADYQVQTLEEFQEEKEPVIPDRLKERINDDLVAKKGNEAWKKVYADFLKTEASLISQYKKLRDKDWDRKIWKDRQTTPRKFINLEIKHYKDTHGPQIQHLLNAYKS